MKERSMARKRKGLGERHHKILGVLEKFTDQNGYPPSIREIGKRTNISSTSVVNYYLDQLAEDGFIERDRNISRGVRLVRRATGEMYDQPFSDKVRNAVEDLMRIPIIGRIFAAAPVPLPTSDFRMFDEEHVVEVARNMIPQRDKEGLFALEVQGDSMIDAMVYAGDIVIMKQVQEARNGEMVAIWLDDKDETTLKYFYKEKGRIRLQPANPTMKPIYVENPRSLRIQGKVVMVIRQMDQRVN
jgi:repressor LexA